MPRVLREAEEENVILASNYPPETHQFILELMRAFQLCYAFTVTISTSPASRRSVLAAKRPLQGESGLDYQSGVRRKTQA
jgi:hypothetical protein